MTNISDEVVQLLSPIIGSGLASSTVIMQCKKIGIDPDQLSSQNISEFAIQIEKVMQIIGGDWIASKIKSQILALK